MLLIFINLSVFYKKYVNKIYVLNFRFNLGGALFDCFLNGTQLAIVQI